MILLEPNRKYYTIRELKDMGCTYYKIGKMEEEGLIRRINRSAYENLCCNRGGNAFVDAAAYVPEGVICLMSAARYYGLKDINSETVDMAIDRKKKVSTLPFSPDMKIFYFDPARMSSGVTQIREGGDTFHIFNMEKTVVDIIYYRNKIGIEDASDVLRNYLKRQDRKIDRLYAYAKLLRCRAVIKTYLEVLV